MKVRLTNKLIVCICMFIAIVNIFSLLLPLFFPSVNYHSAFLYRVYNVAVPQVQLSFFGRGWEHFPHVEGVSYGINKTMLVFYLFMFVATILFAFRKHAEGRLLAFFLSIFLYAIFLYGILSIAFVCFRIVQGKFVAISVVWFFVSLILDIMYFFLFHRMLKQMRKQEELKVEVYETDGAFTNSYSLASRWQRLLHLIVDRLVCILVIPPYIYFLLPKFMSRSGRYNGEGLEQQMNWWLLVACCLLFYYLFMEGILGTTPAKVLSGTRIADENGHKPTFKQTFIRTVSRLVPFEALSCFGRGWHDTWSRTYVLKLKRKGIHGAWYFFVLPIIFLLAWFVNAGLHWYDDYAANKKEQQEYIARMERVNEHYQRLSPGSFIKLEPFGNNDRGRAHYLNVNQLTGDSIICDQIFLEDGFRENMSPLVAMDSFMHNGSQARVAIARNALGEVLSKQYKEHEQEKGAFVKVDGMSFEVQDIFNLSDPELRFESANYDYSYRFQTKEREDIDYSPLIINLKNHGQQAEVVSISPADTSQRWNFNRNMYYDWGKQSSNIQLRAIHLKSGDPYNVEMVLKSISNKKLYRYRIQGRSIKPLLRELH